MFFSSSHSHDPRTMEDFYRPSLIGRGGPIVPTTVPGTDFALKNHMVQLLRQNYQFHAFKDEDANEHLDKYLSITQFIKQNGVSQDIMYVVPAGKIIIIVSPGRLSLVPTGRVLSPGSKDLSRVGFYNWYQSLVALDLGLISSSRGLKSKHVSHKAAGYHIQRIYVFQK
ncbi:hypothetical protein Tco_1308302 [Tanacetum coccineum]